MPELLSDATAMDAVTLHVEDLPGMASYYRDALGLTTLTEVDRTVVLGRGATPVVVLRHTPGLPRASRDQAGLFHTAVLFPTPADLAAAVVKAGGLGAVDAGALSRARELEAMGFLQLTLAASEKVSWTGGFGIVA